MQQTCSLAIHLFRYRYLRREPVRSRICLVQNSLSDIVMLFGLASGRSFCIALRISRKVLCRLKKSDSKSFTILGNTGIFLARYRDAPICTASCWLNSIARTGWSKLKTLRPSCSCTATLTPDSVINFMRRSSPIVPLCAGWNYEDTSRFVHRSRTLCHIWGNHRNEAQVNGRAQRSASS